MKNILHKIFTVLLVLMSAYNAQALSIDWGGTYRAEYTEVDRPSLTSPGARKSYGLNYLGLKGHIIAADGFHIHTRFDVFGSSNASYQNSQFGEIWGLGSTTTASNPNANSNVTSKAGPSSSIKVSQLYLNIQQEYGSILVGRTPFHFGLGINHNAGLGLFDHYMNTLDMVGYKFLVGNLYFMPYIARVYDTGFSQGGVLQDEAIVIEYDNDDAGSMIGLMMERRKGSPLVNDVPVNTGSGTTNNPNGISVDSPVVRTDLALQRTSFVLGRDWSAFTFKLEAGFISGDLGLSKNGKGIKWNAYGVATEMNFPRPESKWEWNIKTGIASGDNPDTEDYESFHFDRNYDVAFLLFNHRLGSYDVLRTGLIRDQYNSSTGAEVIGVGDSLDDEAISNTVYLSPTLKYRWSEKTDLLNSLTAAQIVTNPVSGVAVDKSLGFEWDISVVHRPREKVQWINQLGLLFPGSVFKVNSIPGSDKSFTYGFATKAAISF
jgi:hypothetical protein